MNLMNYYIHPADNRFYVFEFRDVQRTIHFEGLLADYNISFEKFVDDEGEFTEFKYGIAKADFKQALRANNLTEAKYRKPMLSEPWMRYLLVITMAVLIGFAFYGYMVS